MKATWSSVSIYFSSRLIDKWARITKRYLRSSLSMEKAVTCKYEGKRTSP